MLYKCVCIHTHRHNFLCKIIFVLYIIYRVSQKTPKRLVCCAGRQNDHCSRSNPCPETHGLGAVEHWSWERTGVTICSYSFWCPNTAGMQPFIHLRTLIEICRITSTYPNRWTGRGGPIPWSSDLIPLDYFLWGCKKSIVLVLLKRQKRTLP